MPVLSAVLGDGGTLCKAQPPPMKKHGVGTQRQRVGGREQGRGAGKRPAAKGLRQTFLGSAAPSAFSRLNTGRESGTGYSGR